MIRELFVAALFSEAARLRLEAPNWRVHVQASRVAEWIYREEFGLAGCVMYREVGESVWHMKPVSVTPGARRRCICPPPLKVGSWNGDVGHVVQRDPRCTIHGRAEAKQAGCSKCGGPTEPFVANGRTYVHCVDCGALT